MTSHPTPNWRSLMFVPVLAERFIAERLALIGEAAAVVVTMDQPAAALATVRAVRGEYPKLQIFARSRDTKHARDLLAAGANMVIPETVEAGLQLSAFVLDALGVPDLSARGVFVGNVSLGA